MEGMNILSYKHITNIRGGAHIMLQIKLDFSHTTNSFLEHNIELRQKEYLDLEFKLMNNNYSIDFSSLKGIFEARLKDNNFEEEKIPEGSTLFQGNDKKIHIRDKNNNDIKVFKGLNSAKKYIAENMSKGYSKAIDNVKSELEVGFIFCEVFGGISIISGLMLGNFMAHENAARIRYRKNMFFSPSKSYNPEYSMQELKALGIIFEEQEKSSTSISQYTDGVAEWKVDKEASLKSRISDYFSCSNMFLPAGIISSGLLLIATGIMIKIQADGGDNLL